MSKFEIGDIVYCFLPHKNSPWPSTELCIVIDKHYGQRRSNYYTVSYLKDDHNVGKWDEQYLKLVVKSLNTKNAKDLISI